MIKQNRRFQGTFLDRRAYDTCIGIFETYEIPLLPVPSQTRPATTSIPPAVPQEFSSRRPRPASAQDIMSRPVVPLTGHSSTQQKMSNRQTSNNSQTAAILARSTQSQIREQSRSQSRPRSQHAPSSRHTPTSQPARSNLSQLGQPGSSQSKTSSQNRPSSPNSQPARPNLSQLWQPDDSQLQTSSHNPSSSRHTPTSQPVRPNPLWQPDDSQRQTSSQNPSSSRHTPTSQPVWMPPSSPPLARLSQEWQQGNSQPVIPNQQAPSSYHASESQQIWVPSSFQPPPRLLQGSDRVLRNSQTRSDKAIDAPLAYDSSMVMDSMASSQATGGLNTQYPPPSSQLNYLLTSDPGIHSDATMVQSREKKAWERHVQGAHGMLDTPPLPLPLPIVRSDLLNKSVPRFTINQLPTSEASYQPTISPDKIPDGLVARFPVIRNAGEQPLEPIQNAHQLSEDELAPKMVDKPQGDQKRASQATRPKKAKRVSKRIRAATQATGADPSRAKIVTLRRGRSEKNSNLVVPSSIPPVVPLKRSRTYLDDASTTDSSSPHSSPTLPPEPAHVQEWGDRPEDTRCPLQDVPANSLRHKDHNSVNGQREPNGQLQTNGQPGPNGQPEANAEDHTQAAQSLNDIHLSLDAFLSKNHHLLAPAPPPNPFTTFKEQMAHFGALPKEERTKFVNKLITEALVDPNFEKLCQEVEGSWKRFGFEK